MYKCFENNIHLLFLPPHTSHVLQPLDLSIFSPLKGYYRKELNILSLLSDSTPTGKRNFPMCYSKAREKSLTLQNIIMGWKSSGLWPKNMGKSLLSRLLLENSNKAVVLANLDSNENIEHLKNDEESFTVWETPRKAKDLRLQINKIAQLDETQLSARRQLFRKITKSFDEKDYALAQSELRIKQLEATLEQMAPRKRRKVKTSPNSKFAGIREIRKAQIEAGDREIEGEDSDTSVKSTGTMDCIEVQGL